MTAELFKDEKGKQKEAAHSYGTHFIDVDPYEKYHSALKYFFDSLPKNTRSLELLDAACGNQKRTIAGVARLNTEVKLQAADFVLPVDLVPPPPNATRQMHIADLRKDWPFPDNHFDGVMFMWAIHWFGLEGSRVALDNLARVLKPGASAIISTLTPHDVLLKNDFFKRSKITRTALMGHYPHGQISKVEMKGEAYYKVQNDEGVKAQLQANGGKYYVKPSHDSSFTGEKTLIGFSPPYLKEEFAKRNLEVVMEVNKPNKGFPNNYPATLPEGRTHLFYVVRKKL